MPEGSGRTVRLADVLPVIALLVVGAAFVRAASPHPRSQPIEQVRHERSMRLFALVCERQVYAEDFVRENALNKGRRYVAEGRLVVRSVDAGSSRAECRGDGRIYQVGFSNGRWFCNCPALGRCSHQYALGLVTAFEVRA